MVRKLLFAIATTISVLMPLATAAHAGVPVVVGEPTSHTPTLQGGGVLTRSAEPSRAGLVAVMSGLTVLACTLTGILYRRSTGHVPAPLTTYARRAKVASQGHGTPGRTALVPGGAAAPQREPVHR